MRIRSGRVHLELHELAKRSGQSVSSFVAAELASIAARYDNEALFAGLDDSAIPTGAFLEMLRESRDGH